ncbi:MAG TPA: M23 family metallopeptidase [Dyella sp.]|uniref:M23 family metallopeptidase n=1 Tax=Dyella sp. TaxID=1869338 RepID=UPI002D79D461|nr:M23 family metallopeptidase [Dyella sp.]HET6555350.1 M23 family metallopeptidase [Dyella sp.]
MIRKTVVALLLVLLTSLPSIHAEDASAPVEARVPFAPSPFVGSDGLRHLAYELHVSNFYGDTGSLELRDLSVFGDDATTPVLAMDAKDLAKVLRPVPEEHQTPSIAAGKRAVIFVWITLPPGAAVPHTLRHRIEFETEKRGGTVLDGAMVRVGNEFITTIGPPLRGGLWLAHEGPGAAQSHHWGSLVAVNGQLTIPQRYALDLVGIDAAGHAMRSSVKDIHKSTHADWIGYGADVLAVADGVVIGMRDGEAEHAPLAPQPEPASLTANGLFGNYVVLQIAPGVFASYAHLQRGSVMVKTGDHVHRGQVLAHLGQSGNSAAPHLHFQLSNASTFEGSEGIPYVFDRFDFLGPESEGQLFGQGQPWQHADAQPRRAEMPLNDVVIQFPDQ